jgi:hypothetical protein
VPDFSHAAHEQRLPSGGGCRPISELLDARGPTEVGLGGGAWPEIEVAVREWAGATSERSIVALVGARGRHVINRDLVAVVTDPSWIGVPLDRDEALPTSTLVIRDPLLTAHLSTPQGAVVDACPGSRVTPAGQPTPEQQEDAVGAREAARLLLKKLRQVPRIRQIITPPTGRAGFLQPAPPGDVLAAMAELGVQGGEPLDGAAAFAGGIGFTCRSDHDRDDLDAYVDALAVALR